MRSIITRDKRNMLDTTINWMMGIKTEVRKPDPEEVENKKCKKSPYNLFDYAIATVSSAAVVITNVIHPDVALANATYFLSKQHMEKKLDAFNNPNPIKKNTEQSVVVKDESIEDMETATDDHWVPAHNDVIEGEAIPIPAV